MYCMHCPDKVYIFFEIPQKIGFTTKKHKHFFQNLIFFGGLLVCGIPYSPGIPTKGNILGRLKNSETPFYLATLFQV